MALAQAHRECDLNRIYDLEKVVRTGGRCTSYQLYYRAPASNCKTSWYCSACKEFLPLNAIPIIIGSGMAWC